MRRTRHDWERRLSRCRYTVRDTARKHAGKKEFEVGVACEYHG